LRAITTRATARTAFDTSAREALDRDPVGERLVNAAEMPAQPDDRPPICPACGVTMGMTVGEDGIVVFVCLECGFSDDPRSS
jgi:predicted RNA-binding Zn-ribbon protein involved in translation (DUF1610 family)